jgi:hypothetical protein
MAEGLALPLARGEVAITVGAGVETTPGGQRLLALLVNVLARMKGVVRQVHLDIASNPAVVPGTPLASAHLVNGLADFVDSLHWPGAPYQTTLSLGSADNPVVTIGIGTEPGASDLVVASDAWRALVGSWTAEADWWAANPVGPALSAAMSATEAFMAITKANGVASTRTPPRDFAYSAFNYGTNDEAEPGVDIAELELRDLAIVGCGAGGSGAAYVLGMHPNLSGRIHLIEPGVHKLSNLNRYLAALAADVHCGRHKLASLAGHLAVVAPSLDLVLHPRPWEQLEGHPWSFVVSAVDTVESRWQIQTRAAPSAVVVDLAVDDLLYSVLRYGGSRDRCMYCKHPFDPDLAVKQRALRWGVSPRTVEQWTTANWSVDSDMIHVLARTQNRTPEEFADLLGMPFKNTPALLECGSTALRADVPSQAAILPLATTAVAIIGAAEAIKTAADLPALDNWLAHDLRRNPTGPWCRHRGPVATCPHH